MYLNETKLKLERKWKIMTNTTKFTLLPIAIKPQEPINIDGKNIGYKTQCNILGLHLNTNGYSTHVTQSANKAKAVLYTLRRFKNLNSNIKIHLVKACILPILSYPTYPLNSISRSAMLKLQRVQNKALRFALDDYHPYTYNTEQIHQLTNTLPINIIVHNRGNNIKHKLTHNIKDETYINIINTPTIINEHLRFKKPNTHLTIRNPDPIYTS